MSRISDLISALCGEEYKEANKIYTDIKANGTPEEIKSAEEAMSVL